MTWAGGWWSGAIPTPAHPRRLGGACERRTVVVHTTDTHPQDWHNVLRRWCQEAGEGTCAHFGIGRTPNDGVVQLAPIDRNANHAGGFVVEHGVRRPLHGYWLLADGITLVHPNDWAVGIEIDAAGPLRATTRGWRHDDSGLTIPEADVLVDARGRGWHRVTEYQLERLAELLEALEPELAPLPTGASVKADGDHRANQVPWARQLGPRVLGHATLDPVRKTDPGPQVCAWLAERQAKRGA